MPKYHLFGFIHQQINIPVMQIVRRRQKQAMLVQHHSIGHVVVYVVRWSESEGFTSAALRVKRQCGTLHSRSKPKA
jgi:hypothetical protein